MVWLLHIISETFGIGTDETANILVTIFTFSAGIIITLIFKAIESYLNRRNHRKIVRLNIINLMKEMFRQAIAYQKFAEGIKIQTATPTFKQLSISAVGILQQLGYKNIYNAFFNGAENISFKNGTRKIIAFNSLWSTLEFLTVFHQNTFREAREFIDLEKTANNLRNQSVAETFKLIDTIRYTVHRETLPADLADYCNALEIILKTHQKQEYNTNPKIVNDYITLPIIELNNKRFDTTKKYMDILDPINLNSHLSQCLVGYENQNRLLESNSRYFAHLNDSFIISFNKLKLTYKTLF